MWRCKTCSKKTQKFMCTVCHKSKERNEFQARPENNKAILRCNDCRTCITCGEFYKDARHFVCNTRQCAKCTKHVCTFCNRSQAAKEFDGKQIEHANEGQQTKLKCKTCSQAKHYACAAPPCKKKETLMPASSFDAETLHKAKKKGSDFTMICKRCAELGYSSGKNGTQTYRCARCMHNLGHRRFTSNALDNKKKRPNSDLYCKDCRGV